MTRTKRVIIDEGSFETDGVHWSGREAFSYTEAERVAAALDDHVIVQVPIPVYLGGPTVVTQLTVWGLGIISVGPPTTAQLTFMQSWTASSNIFGFPGDFIAVQAPFRVAGTIEIGGGYIDRSDEPNSPGFTYVYDQSAARDRFTITIDQTTIEFDQSGFTVLRSYTVDYRLGGIENTLTTTGFFISPQEGPLAESVWDRRLIYLNDFENLPSTVRDDLVTGTSGNDVILVPLGDPTIIDAQTIAGLGGNDLIFGGIGNDIVIGGQGDDNLNGDPSGSVGGDDNIYGGDGADIVYGGFGSDFIFGDGGDDTLDGEAGDDLIRGGAGNDWMFGSTGNDILDGGTGSDRMRGGVGSDTYFVDDVGDNILEETEYSFDEVYTSLASYILPNRLENLYAIGGAGTFVGNAAENRIGGTNGDDIISGLGGQDELYGRGGSDIFRDTAAGLNGDIINDFRIGDRIIITDATMASFTFSSDGGSNVVYTGGRVNLLGLSGLLIASPAVGGGVQLMLNEVRNDFNGDGRSDILWRNGNGQMSNWLGQPNGGFVQNNANAAAAVPTAWQIAGTGDFNGDGRDDILWRHTDGTLSNWLANEGFGGFTPNDANAATVVSTAWSVVGTGDFNGDGFDDILWRHTDGTFTNWLANDGGRGFFNPNDANAARFVPTSWAVVGTGDFNGDGRDDVLWRNSNGQVSDWLGQANGGFVLNDAVALTQVDNAWKVVGTGDFNGDGRDDILWRHTNGSLSNWLGQANGGFVNNGGVSGVFVPLAWSVVAIGDYNGDGRDDILWRNSNGTVTNWLGTANGSFTPNDVNAAQSVPTAWHVQPEAPFI